jgi:hypothetical protein
MNRFTLAVAAAALASCSTTSNTNSSSNSSSAAGGDGRAQFERLKKLEGNWVSVQEDGTQPAGLKVRYHVIGGGSALVETLFPSGEQEMVTVFHLDGGELVLTHYCSLGNQPHMRAGSAGDSGDSRGDIAFTCDGGTNLDLASDTHMHELRYHFADDSHMRETWTLYEKGHPAEVAPFSLVRTW